MRGTSRTVAHTAKCVRVDRRSLRSIHSQWQAFTSRNRAHAHTSDCERAHKHTRSRTVHDSADILPLYCSHDGHGGNPQVSQSARRRNTTRSTPHGGPGRSRSHTAAVAGREYAIPSPEDSPRASPSKPRPSAIWTTTKESQRYSGQPPISCTNLYQFVPTVIAKF